MDISVIREYCLSLPLATEDMPFGDEVVTLRVCGKIFAMLSLTDTTRVSLKCEPLYAEELRERHPSAICPAWHMNKRHWNDVRLDSDLPTALVFHLVRHSYNRVVSGLSARERKAVGLLDE